MQDVEWAWLAGLFEGEGCISDSNPHARNCGSVMVTIAMTDEDVIDTVHRLFPTTTKWRRELKNRSKPLYVWRVSSRDAVETFLLGILPYMHSRRRARAEQALERLKTNRGAKSLRTHCPKGHPLSGDNLYIARTTGSRSCLTCRQERSRQKAAEDKERRRLIREARIAAGLSTRRTRAEIQADRSG